MTFSKKYNIIQGLFLTIAIGGFGIAAYNLVNVEVQPAEAAETAVVADVSGSDGAIILSDDTGYPSPADEEGEPDENEEAEGDEGEDQDFDEDSDNDDEFEGSDDEDDENEGSDESEDGEDEELDPEDDEDREDEDLDTDGDEDGEDEDSETEDDEGEEGGAEDAAFEQVAQLMGLDVDGLEEALEGGETLAAVAEQNGVDVEEVVKILAAAEEAVIAEELAAGEIDKEEAAEILKEVADFIAFEISTPYRDPLIVAFEALGTDEEAFWEALDSGQSIEALAAEAGVDVQTIADAVIQSETEYLNAMLEAGLISEEDRDEWVSDITKEISEFLSNGFSEESED